MQMYKLALNVHVANMGGWGRSLNPGLVLICVKEPSPNIKGGINLQFRGILSNTLSPLNLTLRKDGTGYDGDAALLEQQVQILIIVLGAAFINITDKDGKAAGLRPIIESKPMVNAAEQPSAPEEKLPVRMKALFKTGVQPGDVTGILKNVCDLYDKLRRNTKFIDVGFIVKGDVFGDHQMSITVKPARGYTDGLPELTCNYEQQEGGGYLVGVVFGIHQVDLVSEIGPYSAVHSLTVVE